MKQKKNINWDAFYLIGGSIGVAIFTTIADAWLGVTTPMGLVAILLAWIMAGVSVVGLFRNTRPQRDGLFSGVFLVHILIFILSIVGGVWFFIGFVFAVIALIISVVFDAIYEGIGNHKQKTGAYDDSTVESYETKSTSSMPTERQAESTRIANLQKQLDELNSLD